jgi:hypothetical protein
MAKPSEHQEVKTPKVFISYAQSDERVGESKFIPIFCELFEDGSPCLPTYLKSRFAIDFSSEAKVDENWENINPRPIRPTVIPKTCARRPTGVCHRAPGTLPSVRQQVSLLASGRGPARYPVNSP